MNKWLKPVEVKNFRSSHQRCSLKKVFLRTPQNSQEKTRDVVSYIIKAPACSFIKKESSTQVFFCKLKFKRIFFKEYLWTTGSKIKIQSHKNSCSN